MAENLTPQIRPDDHKLPQNQLDEELSVEELEEVAGGANSIGEPIGDNLNCGGNCHCT
ncbi:MAG TPA: hypothetical protein VHG51_04705 [Longimicrobiaceae bacterium]|nr:hypothetical protein [Longimicrobiaceae bacterium]